MLKRILCFVLVFAFLSLAACANKNDTEIPKVSSADVQATAADNTVSTDDTTKAKSPVTSVFEKGSVTKTPVSEKAASETVKFEETTARIEKSTSAVTKVTKINVPSEAKNNVTVPEKSQGISILSKTTPVARGKQASITIMGTPNKEFTASFCTKGLNSETKLSQQIKTDSVGIATLTFTVPSSCELGNNMLTVKETGTNNYLQTCITVF